MSNTHELTTPFDGYEVHGIRQFGRGKNRHCEQVPDDEARFWSLFGHIPGRGLECIGDFRSRALAEEVAARITGQPYGKQQRRAAPDEALDAFWQVIVQRYPQTRTGDLSPLTTVRLQIAAEVAIEEWVFANVPATTNE